MGHYLTFVFLWNYLIAIYAVPQIGVSFHYYIGREKFQLDPEMRMHPDHAAIMKSKRNFTIIIPDFAEVSQEFEFSGIFDELAKYDDTVFLMYINYVSEGWTKNQNLNILDALHKVAANCGEKYLKFMKPFRPQQPLDKKGMNIVAHGLGTVIASQLGMAIANDGVFYVKNYFAICPDFKPFMNSLIMANRTHFKHIFFIALKPNGHDGICPKYDATYYGKYMAENAASTDQSAMTKVETVSTAFSVTIKNLLGKQDNLIKKQEPYLFSSIFLSRTPVPSHQKREIIATDFFEVPDVLSRMIVTPASFSQNDKRFLKENRGVQCSAMAIVALTRALTLPVEYWTPKILDKILIAGDKLYTDSRRGKKINHAYLELEEVASKYHIDSIEYAVTFEYDKYVGDDQFSLSSLILAMNKFFAESTEGILLAKKYFVTLFKRTLANGGIVYYLFDSHGRGPMGLNYDGYDNGKRTAVLVKFSSLSDMAEVVIRNFATVPNEKSVDQFRNSIYGKDFQIHKLNVIISSSQQISHYNAAIPVRSHQPIPTMIHREVSQFSRPHASSPNTADPIRLLPQIPNSHTSLIPKTAPGVPQTIRLLPTPPSQNHFNSNNIVRENSRGSASIPVNSLQALSPLPIQPIPPASANPDGLLRRAPHIRRPLPRTPSTTESIHNAPNYLSPPGPPPKPPVTPARRDYYTPSKNNMNFPTPQLVPPVG